MIKRISILLLFMLTCCTDQLMEKTSPLDGVYYITDGWVKFEEADYDRAHDLFSTVLLNNTTQYFGEAYLGLAWNSIYKANTIQGVNNWNSREYQRDISNEYFILASEYVQNNQLCLGSEDCYLSSACKNLLAGQAYNSSYQALESSRKFYDYGLDSSNWVDMMSYSDSTIYYSDWLLNECDPTLSYVFNHDILINHNSIRILRAQAYIRIADFDNAKLELLNIEDLDCNLDLQSVIECLNSLNSE